MKKYFENETWLLEISSDKISSNLILWKKQSCWLWIRFGWLGKYFSLEIFDRKLVNLNFKRKTKPSKAR